jgi:hypothetical protein
MIFFVTFHLPAISSRSGEAGGDESDETQSDFVGILIMYYWHLTGLSTFNLGPISWVGLEPPSQTVPFGQSSWPRAGEAGVVVGEGFALTFWPNNQLLCWLFFL